MRFRSIVAVGSALLVAASTVALTTAAATPAPVTLEKKVYVSKSTGKTKITQWEDPSGKVIAETTGGLGSQSYLQYDEEGHVVGAEIIPEDPKTDADVHRMQAELTPAVSDERRRVNWRKDQMQQRPAEAADPSHDAVATANRAAPFGLIPRAGVRGNTYPYDEGCASTNGEELYIYGCFRRANVPDGNSKWKHTLDSSWSTGHHKGWFGTYRNLKTRHNYRNGHWSVELMAAKPKYTKDVGSCYTWNIGLERNGVGASAGSEICPEEIMPNVEQEWYMHGWFGKTGDDSTWIGSPGHSYMRAHQGRGYGYRFSMVGLEVDCSSSPAGCDFDYTRS